MHLMTRNVNTAFREMLNAFVHRQYNVHAGGEVIDVSVVSRPSRNGGVLMIDEPVTVTYTHPRERVLFNLARNANPFFHLYHALWMLAGRNDVGSLAYYNKRMTEFSDDGETLNGAYGYRWRHAKYQEKDHYGKMFTDQLDLIVNHLKADPTSRRAVLQMWNVEDDLLKIGCKACKEGDSSEPCLVCGAYTSNPNDGSKDVCCNLSVMFSSRDQGKHGPIDYVLDMTVTNRSNDLVWGMLGEDFVTFSVLQEYVAARLGVEVGRYNHFTNNLHVYDWNWKPEEWLSWDTRAGHPDFPQWPEYHGYGFGMHNPNGPDIPMKLVPLVKDPAAFERELPRFVERFSGKTPVEELCVDWKEPFLMDVAQPMLIAFACHKEKDYNGAFAGMDEIAADDWRIAAINWMKKRSK